MPRITAAECRLFFDAVTAKALEIGAPVSMAVVGPEGHLIALERMASGPHTGEFLFTPDTVAASRALYEAAKQLPQPEGAFEQTLDSRVIRCNHQWRVANLRNSRHVRIKPPSAFIFPTTI